MFTFSPVITGMTLLQNSRRNSKPNINTLYHPLNSRAGDTPIKIGFHLI
jgi:hypothetical protein